MLKPLSALQNCNIQIRYRAALAQRPNDVDIATNLLSQEMLVRGMRSGSEKV
jgi:hypothetical protein